MQDAPPDWVGPLQPTETILWQGRPKRGLLPVPPERDGLIGTLLFFVAVLIPLRESWGKFADGDTSHLASTIFLALLVALSGSRAIGSYPWDAYVRHNTRYALSNYRAFVATTLAGRARLNTYPVNIFIPLDMDDYAGGTIWFVKTVQENSEGDIIKRIGFVGIPDCRVVFDLMQKSRFTFERSA